MSKKVMAIVELPSAIPLEDMAKRLDAIIGGITFEFENTGHYEEVPALIASDNNSGMKFILFGIPEGEISDAYILECSAYTTLSIPDFVSGLPLFASGITSEKKINARGYFDYSEELANVLTANGVPAVISPIA